VDEVEQPPVSPPAGVAAASDGAGSPGPTFFAAAVAAAAGSAPTSGGGDAMCTPLTGWETRPLTQQAGSWQQEPGASPPQQLCERQLVPPAPQQHQQQHDQQQQQDGGIITRNWGATEHSPQGLSPALAEVLTGDSGSRAGMCTPLSEEDFVLKASQSYTRAMVVTSPLPPGALYGGAGGHRDAPPTLAAGRDGCSGAGHVVAPACGGGEYRTPPHASSQVGEPWAGWQPPTALTVGAARCRVPRLHHVAVDSTTSPPAAVCPVRTPAESSTHRAIAHPSPRTRHAPAARRTR
jgi:hypothetical protein